MNASQVISSIAFLFLLNLSCAIYALPTIVALARRVPNTASVVVVDVFLGWTLVGWVAALAMAARSIPE